MDHWCGKCRVKVDQDGRDAGGYFTCGYGGSHRPAAERPAAAARIDPRFNRRQTPVKPGRKRRLIREQQDAQEQGREPSVRRAVDALHRHVAASKGERAR